LYDLLGRENLELELVRHDPGPPEPDLSQFELLASTIRELDPEGIPVPMLQAGVTEARHLTRAGGQTYGFLPIQLPGAFEPIPSTCTATATAGSTRCADGCGTASSTRAATCRASSASRPSSCALPWNATCSSRASRCTRTSAGPSTSRRPLHSSTIRTPRRS